MIVDEDGSLDRGGVRVALGTALTDGLAGRGRLVLITGEPGMGKTTLARDLADNARRSGAVVRWAACWAGGGTVAHAPWLTLLAGMGGAGAPALGALLGSDDDDPAAAASARASAYALVAAALEGASTDRPMLLVLDDLHWADAGTIQLLVAMAGQLPALPIVVVGTYRDAEMLPRITPHPSRRIGRPTSR